MKKIILMAGIVLCCFSSYSQMKIGAATAPVSASVLELESTNKGFVLPRVTLTSVLSNAPLGASILTSTMVYNTNAAVTGGSGAGVYYWDGSKWNFIANSSSLNSAWLTAGNAATTSSANFLGTTDNNGLSVRTKALERMHIDSLGDVAIGSVVYDAANRERLLVDYGSTTSNTIANFKGRTNGYLQVNVQNLDSGINSSSDIIATADNGTDSTNYIDMGINSSSYASSADNWGGPNDGYLYSYSRNLVIGTQATNSDIIFLVAGGSIRRNTALRVDGASGNIIVGSGNNSTVPLGNILRAPNASPSSSNISGADFTIQGGLSTGTATGGNVFIKGGTSSSGTGGIYSVYTSAAERMRVDGSGNVGIGNTLPSYLLDVNGTIRTGSASSKNGAVVFSNSSNANTVSLNTGVTSASYSLVLPTSNPATGQVLTATTGGTSTALGWTTPNTGTVTSVGLSLPSIFTVSNSPVTTSGTLTGTLASETANTVFASPNGSAGTPTFRTLVAADLPSLAANYIQNQTVSAQSGAGFYTAGTGTLNGLLTSNGGLTNAGAMSSTGGAINLNANSNFAVNIGTGTTTSNITIGGASNNILLPKFSTAGGIMYASASTGQLAQTAAGSSGYFLTSTGGGAPTWSNAGNLFWGTTGNTGTTASSSAIGSAANNNFIGTTDAKDFVFATNNLERVRISSAGNVGIGTTTPVYPLQVMSSSNPLYLSGVQATSTFSADSILTIYNGVVKKSPYSSLPGGSAGWGLSGNSIASGNFLGTTNAQALVLKAFNVQMGYFDGNISSLALGVSAVNNSSDHNVAIGYSANTNNQYALALGSYASATGVRSIAIGNVGPSTTVTTASGAEAIAIGYSAVSSNVQSTAIGYQSQATGGYGIAIGYGAQANTNSQTTAIGMQSLANQQYATAIGYQAQATGTQSTAIGYLAQTSQSNTILLGNTGTANLYVGIGTATPSAKLHIVGTSGNNPLQLVGLPSGTFGTDNFLTVNSSGVVGYVSAASISGTNWNLTGNAISSGNFLGTTNNFPLILKSNNTQNAYLDANNNAVFTQNSPASMTGSYNLASGYQVMNGANTGNNNLALGQNAMNVNSGSFNIGVGYQVMLNGNSGNYNIALGSTAMNNNKGSYNLAIGDQTLSANAVGANYNFALGNQAMNSTNTGSNNIAVGSNAMNTNSGNSNIGIGQNALTGNSGSFNFGIGITALGTNKGSYNIALGDQAMNANGIGGNYNIGVGTNTLSSNTGLFNIATGNAAMSNNKGSYNIGLGDQTLAANANGANYNIAVGYQTMNGTNTGSNNLAFGQNSLNLNSGNYNIAMGYATMNGTNSGSNNIAFGQNTLNINSGNYNIAMGYATMGSNRGSYNIAMGDNSLNANANAANYNLAMGYQAMNGANSGSNNLAFGQNALNTNTGSYNFAFGNQALFVNQGAYNFAFGQTALKSSTSGNYNFAFGSNALNLNTTGGNNVAIGSSALATNTTGSNDIGIGQNADVSTAGLSNATALGYGAKVGASNGTAIGYNAIVSTASASANAVVIGNTSANVGIGTSTPNTSANLDVSGNFKLGANASITKNIINFAATLSGTAITAGTGNTIVIGGVVQFAAGNTDLTVTIPAASQPTSTQATVLISPNFDLPNGVSIASARLTSINTVKIRFVNASTTAATLSSNNVYITIHEF